MPGFDKQPAELYGEFVSQETKDAVRSALQSENCPFLDKLCVKRRKSDPEQTIGSCTVGYKNRPLVICSHRFLQRQQIFLDCVGYLESAQRYSVVPEVSMPGGSIDYFVVATDGAEIIDYVGIEIQALDTTGSGGIWDARTDLARGRLAPPYQYGINWKMSAKTILVQLHHKAAAFEALDKKLVLVLQAEFFDYIAREFRTDRLRDAEITDAVHFHAYDLVLMDSGLQIISKGRQSTDVLGVERMLGSGQKPEVLEEDVINRIKAKMPRAKLLRPA